MIDMTVIFCQKLRRAAQSGQVIQLEDYAAKLTIDIMGKVVLYVWVRLHKPSPTLSNQVSSDADFNAQTAPNPIVETFRYVRQQFAPAAPFAPFQPSLP
jgi:hypothetical protein